MSKFIDRLKQLSEGTPQRIGFRTSTAADRSRLKIQLVAALPIEGADAAQVVEADATLVRVKRKTGAVEALKKLAIPADVPWGVGPTDAVAAASLAETGADFVVFAAGASLKGLIDTKLGKVIEIDPALGDSLLRTVNALAVDAVLVSLPQPGAALTWQDLLAVGRITNALNKPVLVPVSATISGEELKAVWDAGADAVVVDITADTAASLKDLRQKISALEFPAPKRGDRGAHLVPRVSLEPEQQEDQGEEEEE
jgi:hypothetical protein